ncbi:hypothetical protein OKW46_001940 [Paraburkholderia sp. WSM4179]|nr:hypothetical protein [Paraburkholderia sp. WSM4179]
MNCRQPACLKQLLPEDYMTPPAQPLHDGLLAGYVNRKKNIMKQRYIMTGIIAGLLAVLNINAHAAYQEEWLSPQALQKEEAARFSRHPSTYTCRGTGARCNRISSTTASAKSRAEIHAPDAGRADDPIAAFAKKRDATRSAHRS